ncbi:FKBP-type peptidyl-prolyl cis-trans isomerase [Nocardioides sp. SYSU DS0651]|uniref:FKBP-type peptidyl-prolyl cis-trans isomerase n=1 Tax=Nocardioides sp. SYSU DS0651 TaxID=3415955 RepID=UPI003F4C2395
MLDRLRRPTTLLLTALLPASLALSACGGDGDDLLEGFDAVSISGEPGEAPEIDWKGRLEPAKAEAKVLEEGDGAELAKGDRVLVNYVVSNGWTHEEAVNTYGDEAGGFMTEIGAKEEPQQVDDILNMVVREEIEAGMTVGTRIAVTVGSDEVLEEYLGNPQVSQYYASKDIGNEDGLLVVADVAAKVADGPEGQAQRAPGWAPEVVTKKGEPVRLDFTGVPEPNGKLRVATLVEGTGDPVESGDVVAADYLGAVYGAKKPFDESYSKDQPLPAVISEEFGTVVKGWSRALEGVPAGSRVLIQIPPKLGYGKEGSPPDIPKNATLYFVVDVLATA